ncbi:MAG: hypothetical protein M1817_004109 [Caeruleum heppii]|nr:MAG: hypothetical protein M1817_004109 [Caeruleum heppii]
MASMETGRTHSDALPSIKHLHFDGLKRDELDLHQRQPSAAALGISQADPISPANMYSGPPPPYSLPSSTASATPIPALNGLLSPPESRRTSGDDKPERPHRQSLPSIQEALGREQALAYPMSAGASAQPQAHDPRSSISPKTPIPRSHPAAPTSNEPLMSSAPPSATYPPQHPPSKPLHPVQSPYPAPEMRQPGLPSHDARDSRLPSLPSLRAAPSPIQTARPLGPLHGTPQLSPRFDESPSSAGPMPAGNAYGHYHSSYYPSHSTVCGPPSYPTAAPHHPDSPYTSKFDGSEVSRVQEAQQSYKNYKGVNGERYGTSVKRHLDFFDLEASLNEIADSSGRMNEFSRDFRHRAREVQMQRNGVVPGALPSIAECDEMIKHQSRVQDLLQHLREMLVTQASAQTQSAHENRYQSTADYGAEDSSAYADDNGSTSFLGHEAKKRRGRAAPPGRCHSCNRAETPEWRRGPDGARTLCNACGLHYAKLTRKMGAKVPTTGSSLRPKAMGSGSPRV